jgi:chemotaxis regulatin CheY-phosphate phosphatase CheZ
VVYSITELIEMARALSEGDFEHEFRQHFEGELGRLAAYIEAVRQNLKALAPSVAASADLMPQAAKSVAEISQHAEVGANSILELVEEMLADQEKLSDLLAEAQRAGGTALDPSVVQAVAEKSRHRLMSLMSYLSFQDVVRQHAEKVREMIELVEKRILELLVKFKVKINERMIKEGDGREVLREEVRNLSGDMGLDQALVDTLLGKLE